MPDPRNTMPPALSRREWYAKFRNALRGIREGARGQSSCWVHAVATLVVFVIIVLVPLNGAQRAILAGCVFSVWSAEWFNSALERMACAITSETDPHIHHALNIASGAVLIVALGSVAVAALILVPVWTGNG